MFTSLRTIGPSKLAFFGGPYPCKKQVQTLPLEGPRSLWMHVFLNPSARVWTQKGRKNKKSLKPPPRYWLPDFDDPKCLRELGEKTRQFRLEKLNNIGKFDDGNFHPKAETYPIGSMYGNIYLHLVDVYGKCAYICHTWILWDVFAFLLAEKDGVPRLKYWLSFCL